METQIERKTWLTLIVDLDQAMKKKKKQLIMAQQSEEII